MRPAILPPTVEDTIQFRKKKVLNCLRLIKYVCIGFSIPATLPTVIAEVGDLVLLRLSTLPIISTEDVIVAMFLDVDIGYNRPSTIPLAIMEK